MFSVVLFVPDYLAGISGEFSDIPRIGDYMDALIHGETRHYEITKIFRSKPPSEVIQCFGRRAKSIPFATSPSPIADFPESVDPDSPPPSPPAPFAPSSS